MLPEEGPLRGLVEEGGARAHVAASRLVARHWSWAVGPEITDAVTAEFEAVVVEQARVIAPDFILSQTIVSPWGAMCAESLSVPHLNSVREYGRLDHGLPFSLGLDACVAALRMSSAQVFCVSRDVRSVLFPGAEDEGVEVIYSHIQVAASHAAEARRSSARPVVGIFGALHPSKGQLELVRACVLLAGQGVDFQCELIGDAGDADYVEAIRAEIAASGLEEIVRLRPFVYRPELEMARMATVVSCARREAMGRTLIEASLLRVPVIYASTGGAPEVFRDKIDALAYPLGDIAALAESIRLILTNPASAAVRAESAAVRCGEFFSEERYCGAVHRRLLALSRTRSRPGETPVWDLVTARFPRLMAQVFVATGGAYSEKVSRRVGFPSGRMRSLQFAGLPTTDETVRLRFDPLDRCGQLKIGRLTLVRSTGRDSGPERLEISHNGGTTLEGLAVVAEGPDWPLLFAFNDDPRIELQPMPRPTFGEWFLEAELCAVTDGGAAANALCVLSQSLRQAVERLDAEGSAHRAVTESLRQERAVLAGRESELASSRADLALAASEQRRLAVAEAALQARLAVATRSFFWKSTAPLRYIENLLRVPSRAVLARRSACYFNLEADLGKAAICRLDNPVRISGWFFDDTGRAARVVLARVGDRVVPFQAVERPDVVAHFRGQGRELGDARVGFSLELKTGPGLKHIVIEALCHDDVAVPLQRGLRWMRPYQAPREKLAWAGDDDPLPAEPDRGPAPVPEVRAIAFYLPQFHAIPENDLWWGKGFTEWTNVRPARPQFDGHYQPHVPHSDLGHYDLNDSEVLDKQARLARAAGVYGFCFYYYWFGGKRLLEMPLERLLATGRPEMPFCYCWANENWSRRWDGLETEVLIAQSHSPEDNDAVIRDLMRAFRDPRYIRVHHRPLLLVYRPALIPDATRTFARWRELCRAEGVGEIHLAGVKGHGCSSAEGFGLDALVEFPPNDSGASPLASPPAGLVPDFAGKLYDYREVRHLCWQAARAERPIYRGVMPSWDNTARRKNKGSIFTNSSPGAYLNWLRKIADRTRAEPDPEHRLLFINAWNEWAEGCHLEPDERHGFAWLNATRRALGSWPSPAALSAPRQPSSVLVLGHDAERAGAQTVLLSMLRAWSACPPPFSYRLACVVGGPLRAEFERICPTLVLSDRGETELDEAEIERMLSPRPALIVANTVAHGALLRRLAPYGVPVVTYCHELQNSIERWAPGGVMEATLARSSAFFAASEAIARNLRDRHGVAEQALRVIPAAIDLWSEDEAPSAAERSALAAELELPADAIVVFGVGTTDWRKGSDLFVRVAALACAGEPRLRFVWIGGDAGYSAKEIAACGLRDRVRFLGPRPAARRYFYVGHIFALTSREDPCPLVALEAACAGLPVVCFKGAGDIPAVLGPDAGAVVPMEDTEAFAAALIRMARDSAERARAGSVGARRVADRHDIRAVAAMAAAEITRRLPQPKRPLVSVVVPNYNHARYLGERLRSIATQTLQDIEIILLDDASTDHSRDLLQRFAAVESRARYLPNTTNSGSTFKQWRKGLNEARGKYVWIAESDDSAQPALLERLVARLEAEPDVALACCQLRMMDAAGNLGGTPDEWLGELHPTRWNKSFTNDGRDEISRYLSRKNTILNASGVVFRNFEGVDRLVDDSMRLCADWLFWARLLVRGKIAYEAEPLNHWRLQSSNARNRPPGELEWVEGERILNELASLAGLTAAESAERIGGFAERCQKWKNAGR